MQLDIFHKTTFKPLRVLIGCECEGGVRDAFTAAGHYAISCDLKDSTTPGNHYKGSVFDIVNDGFDLGIFHPPCTYLAVTANIWFKEQPPRKSGALVGKAREAAREEAIEFFIKLAEAPIPRICLENPVGVMSTRWKKPTQIIQPFEFGHPEPKKTCLWLINLPPLRGTQKVEPEYHTTESGKRVPKWFFYADASKGQAHRAAIRSKTFPGIAQAMADQWGKIK